jgi:hypothetical protein
MSDEAVPVSCCPSCFGLMRSGFPAELCASGAQNSKPAFED